MGYPEPLRTNAESPSTGIPLNTTDNDRVAHPEVGNDAEDFVMVCIWAIVSICLLGDLSTQLPIPNIQISFNLL
jgi:hypothetical protein